MLIGVLLWGALVYGRLGQQEDPTIPHRTAMLVTAFPGATASKATATEAAEAASSTTAT